MTDDEFKYCGIEIGTKTPFFDYSCDKCGHVGRWLVPKSDFPSASDALRFLLQLTDPDGKMVLPQRENAQDFLRNVHGVDDFLRLGGKNAPREPGSQ